MHVRLISLTNNSPSHHPSFSKCLARIGKDILIEADDKQFMLRALNDSKSAFSAFSFSPDSFFEEYACGSPSPENDEEEGGDDEDGTQQRGGPVSCKLMVKPLQHVLRGVLKRVLSLRMYLNEAASTPGEGGREGIAGGREQEHIQAGAATAVKQSVEPQIILDMQCEWGVLKRHAFQLQDCEVVHAVFNREGASCLRAQANHLSQMLDHVQGAAEVAFVAGKEGICLRTWRGGEEEGGRGGGGKEGGELLGTANLNTEMTVSAMDFDGYEYMGGNGGEEEEVGLVFSMREVKAFLGFCEGCECTAVSFYYHHGGGPVLFVFEEDGGWEGGRDGGEGVRSVELVMATVAPVLTEGLNGVHRGGGTASSGGGRGGGMGRVKKEKHGAREGGGGGKGRGSPAGEGEGRGGISHPEEEQAQEEREEEEGMWEGGRYAREEQEDAVSLAVNDGNNDQH